MEHNALARFPDQVPGCGRVVMLPRMKLEKSVKIVSSRYGQPYSAGDSSLREHEEGEPDGLA